MITNYGIYNNHELDNTLLVLISDLKMNRSEKRDEMMEVLYNDNKVIGYKIKNFIRFAKIKYSGIIFLPIDPLIDVINSILKSYGFETLEYKKESGYITKMNNGKMMVFAKEGTYLRNQEVSKGKYCTYHDLYIKNENENELVVIEDTIKENEDFFMSEVK